MRNLRQLGARPEGPLNDPHLLVGRPATPLSRFPLFSLGESRTAVTLAPNPPVSLASAGLMCFIH
jgi:hypothetical protein